MKKELIYNVINQAKANKTAGQYVSLEKTKDLGKGITKVSTIVIRLGVNYANMADAPSDPSPLPWGQWVEGYEGWVIEHKGVLYLRVAAGKTVKAPKASVYLAEDGSELTYDQVKEIVGEKKLQGSAAPVYNIKFDNIVDISTRKQPPQNKKLK